MEVEIGWSQKLVGLFDVEDTLWDGFLGDHWVELKSWMMGVWMRLKKEIMKFSNDVFLHNLFCLLFRSIWYYFSQNYSKNSSCRLILNGLNRENEHQFGKIIEPYTCFSDKFWIFCKLIKCLSFCILTVGAKSVQDIFNIGKINRRLSQSCGNVSGSSLSSHTGSHSLSCDIANHHQGHFLYLLRQHAVFWNLYDIFHHFMGF